MAIARFGINIQIQNTIRDSTAEFGRIDSEAAMVAMNAISYFSRFNSLIAVSPHEWYCYKIPKLEFPNPILNPCITQSKTSHVSQKLTNSG